MDGDQLPARITNQWTDEQRLALLILYRFFSNCWREFGLIFDATFRSELHHQGFVNHPIPYLRVRTQWHDLMIKRGPEFRQVYKDISFQEGISVRSPLYLTLQALRLSAYNIGLHLRERTHDDSQILKKFDKIRKKECYQKLINHSQSRKPEKPNESADIDADESATDVLPTAEPVAIPVSKLPPLLFRCYDETSQGRNSTTGFNATKSFSAPANNFPSCQDPTLLQEAQNHMQHWNHVPTALISTTSSLIFAFKKARDCLQRDGKPHIVAIDTRALANCTRVYPAAPLCSQLKTQGRVDFRYKGAYEFLIWQSIPSDAVLGSFSYCDLRNKVQVARDLANLLQMNIIEDMSLKNTSQIRNELRGSSLSESHGRAIAHFASIIRKDAFSAALWVADFVDVVIQNWRLKENGPWRDDTKFRTGLHRGFQDSVHSQTTIAEPQTTLPLTPPETPVKARPTCAMSGEESSPGSLEISPFSSQDLPLYCQKPATGGQRTESTLVDVEGNTAMASHESGFTWFDGISEYLEGN